MRDFDATVRNYRDAVTRRCKWMCRTGWMDPEDLQQEFWLDVARMWPRIEPDVGITALLFRILGSTASRLIGVIHTQRRGGEGQKQRGSIVRHVSVEDWDAPAPATQDDTVELIRVAERMDAVLTPRERDVLIRRALGDEQEEIGQDFGVTRQRIQQIEVAARKKVIGRRRRG